MNFPFFVINCICGCVLYSSSTLIAQCFSCKQAPPGTIWCDDFEEDIPMSQKYFEYNNNSGDFIRLDKVGRDLSYGMRVKWQKGEVGAGSLSKSFGKTPDSYIGKNAARPGETFTEIYWRMDVKAQEGWIGGGPAKLSRAMCLANSNWAQGMMAHLWSGGPNDYYLGMDPASGIGADGKLKATKYNDFANLRWLGFKAGTIPLFQTENSAKWFCIVGHVKLNTPGLKDGVFEFWINDTLQAASANLDWHSNWNNDPNNLHINAVFFENYWNAGSPVEQERYFDNLVISTEKIPCACNVTTTQNRSETDMYSLFPNPANDHLQIKFDQQQFPLELSIYDVMSNLILHQKVYSQNEVIELNELHDGMYYVRLKGFPPAKFIVRH